MAMELSQATQMIQWLDEERRKDKAALAALQERVEQQVQQIERQARQLQELQTALASAQAMLAQVTGFDQALENYKHEVIYMLDQRDEQRKKEHREMQRVREIEVENITRTLGEMQNELSRLPRVEEQLPPLRAEDGRLNRELRRVAEQVADLSKRSDDRVQAVTYLEEQRRADNRRIAGLESETTALRKRIEAQATKLPLLETAIQKHKSQIDEAVEQVKGFEKPLEEMRVAEFRREQQMKKYLDQAEAVKQELEKLTAERQRLIEQHQLVKRALEKLEGFQGRLEKRQNEVAEMQRLAEDRIKRQWEEWQTHQEKERSKRQLLVEEKWRGQEKVNQEHAGQLKQLCSKTDAHYAQLEALWQARREDAHHAFGGVEALIARVDTEVDRQLGALHSE